MPFLFLIYNRYTVPNLENLQNSSITYFGPRKLPQTHILTYLNFRIIHHDPNFVSHIMEMSHIASKLKALKLLFSNDMLMHLVLLSLPTQYNQFKVCCNCQKDKWSLNEFILYCVQEEDRLKQDKTKGANLTTTPKNKDRGIKRNNMKAADKGPTQKKQPQENKYYYFCNKE